MFNEPLISENNHWVLWAILLIIATFGFWAERTKWGSKLSGMMIALLSTFLLSNLSIIPSDAPTYDMVWSYLVPLAIPLLLFKANLRKIFRETGPTLIAFVMGGIGTIIGTIVAYQFIFLGDEGWKLAGIFCATYIGGTMNYMATAEVMQLKSGDLLTAGVAADNLVMTLYFFLLFTLPSINFIIKLFNKKQKKVWTTFDELVETPSENSLFDLSKALAISFTICAIGFTIAELAGFKGGGVLILTALIVIIATIFPEKIGKIKGADTAGLLMMQIFFAAIGASANIKVVLEVGPVLFLFAGVILIIHLLFILTTGKILKLDLKEIIIASNANMGGPTTAAAMAASRKWNDLVLPAILCGTLGYSIATFIGAAVGYWLK